MNSDFETPSHLVRSTPTGLCTVSAGAGAVTGRHRHLHSKRCRRAVVPRKRLPLLAATAREAVRDRARSRGRRPLRPSLADGIVRTRSFEIW